MSEPTKIPHMQTDWNVWISYTVQPGTKISHLLKRADMSKSEWNAMNAEHPASKPLKAGDEVWIKDPIATCEKAKADLMRYTDAISTTFFDYQCESVYGSFKPLRAFTKVLKK